MKKGEAGARPARPHRIIQMVRMLWEKAVLRVSLSGFSRGMAMIIGKSTPDSRMSQYGFVGSGDVAIDSVL
jgi:hypothetical protein